MESGFWVQYWFETMLLWVIFRDQGEFDARGPRRDGVFRDRGGRGSGTGFRGPPRGGSGGPRKREFDRQSGSDKRYLLGSIVVCGLYDFVVLLGLGSV